MQAEGLEEHVEEQQGEDQGPGAQALRNSRPMPPEVEPALRTNVRSAAAHEACSASLFERPAAAVSSPFK